MASRVSVKGNGKSIKGSKDGFEGHSTAKCLKDWSNWSYMTYRVEKKEKRPLESDAEEELQVEDANGKCLPHIDAQIFLLILYPHV